MPYLTKAEKKRLAHILIVDDDPAIREVLRLALEEEGHQTIEAPDGATALSLLRTTQQRLIVLLDHLMPGLNGADLLRTIQDEPDLARRHGYVLLTARSRISAPTLETARALSVPVVKKPFELDELLDIISQTIQRLAD